ncbi:uncharacterized protein LOC116849323 isoform X2 [Odontomachus brunneus]|uniref:uncharacterized protein LOC116849323 isoform X2 n=1 Tax=Odontomachus brunneus TaxID=486640 RepID=UPI0013F1EB44|nr:uncharacterized protein LOC116849323 isoform X2 [Odontomachus brunneus]
MFVVSAHNLKMSEQIRSNAEYNRRAAIIEGFRAGRSRTKIIRFFGYPRSTVYDVAAKYLASETSEKGSANPTRKSHSKEKSVRTPAIIERAQELISEDPGLSLTKLAKTLGVSDTTMRRIAEEDLRFKSYVIKVRQMLSEAAKMNRVARCWPPNSPDLNPLDYYVWSVIERVTNKSRHPNVTSLQTAIEAAFANIDKDALQRACQRFRMRIEAVIKAKGGYIE